MMFRACVIGLAVTATTLVSANQPLTLRVSPNVAFAPANLIVRATIEANADNRLLEVVADSSDFYRSSAIQLEGDRAPRVSNFEFRGLPPGEYQVMAVIVGANGRPRAVAHHTVMVAESGAAR